MADRYTQVVLLCEDYMHFNFVRRYLMQRGIESRRIRPQYRDGRPRSRHAARHQTLSDRSPGDSQQVLPLCRLAGGHRCGYVFGRRSTSSIGAIASTTGNRAAEPMNASVCCRRREISRPGYFISSETRPMRRLTTRNASRSLTSSDRSLPLWKCVRTRLRKYLSRLFGTHVERLLDSWLAANDGKLLKTGVNERTTSYDIIPLGRTTSMSKKSSTDILIAPDKIQRMVHIVRGQRVMLDFDLARLYGVPTSALNQAVRRNVERFPEDFAYPLTRQEVADLISQIVISKKTGRGGPRKAPLGVHGTRRCHAFQRTSIADGRAGKHRDNSHLRSAPPADGHARRVGRTIDPPGRNRSTSRRSD